MKSALIICEETETVKPRDPVFSGASVPPIVGVLYEPHKQAHGPRHAVAERAMARRRLAAGFVRPFRWVVFPD